MKATNSCQLEIYECNCGQRMHLPEGSGLPKGWISQDQGDGIVMICPDCQRPRREPFKPFTGFDQLDGLEEAVQAAVDNPVLPRMPVILTRPVRISAIPIKAKSPTGKDRILISVTYPGPQNLSVTADFNVAEGFELVEEVTAALRELNAAAAPARGEAA
jgi:hypothetical protein